MLCACPLDAGGCWFCACPLRGCCCPVLADCGWLERAGAAGSAGGCAAGGCVLGEVARGGWFSGSCPLGVCAKAGAARHKPTALVIISNLFMISISVFV